jgi:lantibiotic leader peptide-processing serine protease
MRPYLVVRSAAAAAAVVALACSDQPLTAPPTIASPTASLQAAMQPHTRIQHLVTLRGAEGSDFAQAVQVRGGQVERRHPEIGVVTVTGLSAAAAAELAARPDVADVTQDVAVQWIPPVAQLVRGAAVRATSRSPAAQGTDQSGAFFFAHFQWNMRVTQADAAWGQTPGGLGALVCILDTGVDPLHIDLIDKVEFSKSTSFVASEPFLDDLNSHGTFVSAIVTSNGLGVASVAPDARLCEVKVLDQTGSGLFGDVIAGIIFATNQGAHVINMSLGAYVDRHAPGAGPLIRALQAAVTFAASRGVLVVAAAGNDAINLDTDPPRFLEIPAQLAGVISVGATGPIGQQNFDRLASYSNFGGRTGITLVAPGGDFVLPDGVLEDVIISACSQTETALLPLGIDCSGAEDFYVFATGTSAAAPMVSGEGAVVQSTFGHAGAGEPLAPCIRTGVDVVGPRAIFGRGRMNVVKAAACAQASGAAVSARR